MFDLPLPAFVNSEFFRYIIVFVLALCLVGHFGERFRVCVNVVVCLLSTLLVSIRSKTEVKA